MLVWGPVATWSLTVARTDMQTRSNSESLPAAMFCGKRSAKRRETISAQCLFRTFAPARSPPLRVGGGAGAKRTHALCVSEVPKGGMGMIQPSNFAVNFFGQLGRLIDAVHALLVRARRKRRGDRQS